MKKKLILWTVGVVFAALLLLVLLAPTLSRAIWGRSLEATLFSWQFHKGAYTTEDAFREYLAGRREENAADYRIPPDVEFTVSVGEYQSNGMQVFMLNGSPETEERIIWYFPGGSYIDPPRGVQWEFLNALAEDTDSMILVPIYPKLPDNDAETAYAALTDVCLPFISDMDHRELIFMGDSAGGGMALSFAMQLRDAGLEVPDKLILICPWLDVTLSNPEIPQYEKKDTILDAEQLRHLGVLWAGELDPADPVVSPLYGDLEGLGRISLLIGTSDLLYPDVMALDSLLSSGGIPHDTYAASGMFHVWPLYIGYDIPETQAAYDQIVNMVLG